MKEIITYSAELQYIWDLQQRAEKSDDATAQLNLAKFYLRLKQESTNRKAFALLKKTGKARLHHGADRRAVYACRVL